MVSFSRGSRPGRQLWIWAFAVVVLAAGFSPSVIQAQACGGNSTVDILGAQAAAGARNFLAQLQAALRSSDKERIEGMVSYPLLVLRPGRRTHIRRQNALLANYNRIFTPAIRKAILDQTAKCLFGNSSGAMVGNGEVWFREQAQGEWKIVTINQSVHGH